MYAHKLDLAAAADAAGFHGMFLAEHQGTPLSIDGAPSVLLSAIFQRTRRLRAGALSSACRGTIPTASTTRSACSITSRAAASSSAWARRVADRVADLRHDEYRESRERYREALEVFFKACANPALDFDGKLFHYRDMELQVKPRQRPYPPLWFPSSNRESIEFTARHGYHTAFLGSWPTASPISTATATYGSATVTIPAGTTRT